MQALNKLIKRVRARERISRWMMSWLHIMEGHTAFIVLANHYTMIEDNKHMVSLSRFHGTCVSCCAVPLHLEEKEELFDLTEEKGCRGSKFFGLHGVCGVDNVDGEGSGID